jgi:hypothetical protein
MLNVRIVSVELKIVVVMVFKKFREQNAGRWSVRETSEQRVGLATSRIFKPLHCPRLSTLSETPIVPVALAQSMLLRCTCGEAMSSE